MAITCILVFVLTLIVNTVTSQRCQRLFMQGLDNTELLPYAELSGFYHLTNITISGFPTYQHETHPNEFFFYNRTQRVLVIGENLLLAETNGKLPRKNVQYPYSDVIRRWRIYQPVTKRFAFRIFL